MTTLEQAYQNQILQKVSRTFALTIPQLPAELSTVVGNAYLLCRIADTIEDDPALDVASKRKFSQQLVQVIAGTSDALQFSQQLYPLLSQHTIEAEKNLIQNTELVTNLTHSFTPPQQAALLRCVSIMTKGMAEFQQHNSGSGLADLNTMNLYCYYVAGVVGEMLTDIFCAYSPQIAANNAKLQKLALAFGQALQMTNILKDIWQDLERGACWLPRDIFASYDFDLQYLTTENNNQNFQAGLKQLIGYARTHIRYALEYILLIPKHEVGIRRFCLWALGMAILTLRNINQRPDFTAANQVKISRSSVKATMLIGNTSIKINYSLKLLHTWLTHELPPEQPVDLDELYLICHQQI